MKNKAPIPIKHMLETVCFIGLQSTGQAILMEVARSPLPLSCSLCQYVFSQQKSGGETWTLYVLSPWTQPMCLTAPHLWVLDSCIVHICVFWSLMSVLSSSKLIGCSPTFLPILSPWWHGCGEVLQGFSLLFLLLDVSLLWEDRIWTEQYWRLAGANTHSH